MRRREEFRIRKFARRYDRETGKFTFDIGYETRTDITDRTVAVAEAFGMSVPPNKAVVGGNAFAHSSGIHVDGFLKERMTYEIMKPEDVGAPKSRVVLTARTGRHGVSHRLDEIGYKLSNRSFRIYLKCKSE